MNANKILRSVSILSVCVLSACAHFGKQAPLDNPTAYSLPAGQTAEVQAQWWRSLKDGRLNRYMEQAMQQAPALQVVQARLAQAQAQLGMVEAADKTQVGFSATGFGMYNGSKPDIQKYNPNADPNHWLSLANAGLQASWVFDFWGKNRAQIAAVVGQQNALRYEMEQTRLVLAQAIAAQYFAWQNIVGQQEILQQRIDNAAATEKLLQQRVRAQLLPGSAVYPAQMAQQQMKLQILALDRDAARLRHSLAALTGQPATALDDEKPNKMAELPAVKVANLKADLLGRRPDIAAQRELLASKMQGIEATKAEFYPNIELKLLAGLSRIDAFDLVNSHSRMMGLVPAVTLPIFTSGALQSKLAGKNAEYNQQVAQYNQTVLDAMKSAADALSDYQITRQQLLVQQDALGVQKKAAASALRRVQAELENKVTYLQKQDDVLQQQAVYLSQQSAGLTAWSNLQAQLGGGFQDSAAR